MNLPLMPMLVADALWLLLLVYAACHVKWASIRAYPQTLNVFFAVCLILTLIAYLRTGVLPGLELHLFGAVSATLMMGWPLAFLAMSLVHVLVTILHEGSFLLLGVQILFGAGVPILSCLMLDRFVIKKLPHNPFIFVLGNAFVGGALSIIFSTCALAVLYHVYAGYSWEQLWHKYLMFMPLFAYPEGFINGTFIASMVAFYPRWLSHFDEQSYFGFSSQ